MKIKPEIVFGVAVLAQVVAWINSEAEKQAQAREAQYQARRHEAICEIDDRILFRRMQADRWVREHLRHLRARDTVGQTNYETTNTTHNRWP